MSIVHFLGSVFSSPTLCLPFSFLLGLLFIYSRNKFGTSKKPKMSSSGMIIFYTIMTVFLTYRGFLLDNKSFYDAVFVLDTDGSLSLTMTSFMLGAGFTLAEVFDFARQKTLEKSSFSSRS
jgi:hypothetical protein